MVLNGADRSNGPSSVRGVGEAPCFGIVHRRDQGVDVRLHRLGDVWLCSVQTGEEGHRILEGRTLLGPGLRKAAPFSDRADSTSGMRIARRRRSRRRWSG